VCDSVVFTQLQCELEPRNLDGTNLGSCWCFQRAKRFGERETLLPCACSGVQREGGGRTGRRPRESKAGGIQRVKLKKFKCNN